MAGLFTTGGILALFIRILWLWGATGAMLSLAGILGKLTISTSTDAVGQMINAVKGIATTAALVATGAGRIPQRRGGCGLARDGEEARLGRDRRGRAQVGGFLKRVAWIGGPVRRRAGAL